MIKYVVFILSAVSLGCHCVGAKPNATGRPLSVPPVISGRRSGNLLQSLRSQLMRNNYDYQNMNLDGQRGQREMQQRKNKQKGLVMQSLVPINQFKSNKRNYRTREAQHAYVQQQPQQPNYAQQSPYNNEAQDNREVFDPVYIQDRYKNQEPLPSTEMRDALGPNFMPDRHATEEPDFSQEMPEAYDPTYSKKRRDALNRGIQNERDGYIQQEILYSPMARDGRVQHVKDNIQDMQGKDEASDKAAVLGMDNKQEAQGIPPPNDTQDGLYEPYDPQDGRDSQTDYNGDMGYIEKGAMKDVVVGDAQANPDKRSASISHVIDKKDLLYYMDDDKFRRKNDVSAELSGCNTDGKHGQQKCKRNTGRHHGDDESALSLNSDVFADSLSSSNGADNVQDANDDDFTGFDTSHDSNTLGSARRNFANHGRADPRNTTATSGSANNRRISAVANSNPLVANAGNFSQNTVVTGSSDKAANTADNVRRSIAKAPTVNSRRFFVNAGTLSNNTRRSDASAVLPVGTGRPSIANSDSSSSDNIAPYGQTERSIRSHSSFVTVAGTNVTYKLLTVRGRGAGRRSAGRRFLEERGPGGSVALISLDKAPLPQFRLPKVRRQYMHEHQDMRPPLADAISRHHH